MSREAINRLNQLCDRVTETVRAFEKKWEGSAVTASVQFPYNSERANIYFLKGRVYVNYLDTDKYYSDWHQTMKIRAFVMLPILAEQVEDNFEKLLQQAVTTVENTVKKMQPFL